MQILSVSACNDTMSISLYYLLVKDSKLTACSMKTGLSLFSLFSLFSLYRPLEEWSSPCEGWLSISQFSSHLLNFKNRVPCDVISAKNTFHGTCTILSRLTPPLLSSRPCVCLRLFLFLWAGLFICLFFVLVGHQNNLITFFFWHDCLSIMKTLFFLSLSVGLKIVRFLRSPFCFHSGGSIAWSAAFFRLV